MKKIEKVELVKNVTSELKAAKSAVFVNFAGLDVKAQQSLKKKLKDGNARMVVVKNTLLALAAKEAGFPQDSYSDTVLAGQTAVILSDQDAVSPVQIVGRFITENEKPEFKAGVVEGKFADKDGLTRISKLPAKEVLYAQVVGGMSAPMYGLVGTLQGNLQKLIWILKSKAQA